MARSHTRPVAQFVGIQLVHPFPPTSQVSSELPDMHCVAALVQTFVQQEAVPPVALQAPLAQLDVDAA